MIRAAASLAIASLLAGCAAGARPDPASRTLAPRGEPSTVIAAELAFARAAREKGTWTAFREYATEDAVWPGPAWENVQAALKGVADPAQAIVWGPDMVWVSCDGSFALSTGPASYPSGRTSRFATIWQRQNDGGYRWVVDQGFDLEDGHAPREMISGRKAECPRGMANRVKRVARARRGEAWQAGQSDDGTLAWNTELAADCRRTLVVTARQDGAMTEVFRRTSSVPPVAAGSPPPSC
ncbi:hypothetical protein A6F68_00682 [Tsuneonella dongtanensis]|uniref:DUF4440 domain-containing protein n=1 Tax=Tsuneonella dongtanensis TaxID=692370 RepID=A0A1B2AAT3_9SPHN|nr:hypothetical protein [Tsuneonella dongtanensis]ANY19211.1 hypothetical protein A6F68_00682 [Tsuneonella dongtanensis]